MDHPLTGNKDADKTTMRYLDREDLSNLCKVKNRYIHSLCTEKSLWMLRILDNFKFLVPDYQKKSNEDILDELLEYAIGVGMDHKNELFWRKFYNYLEYAADNMTELYLRLVLATENDPNYKNTNEYKLKTNLIRHVYDLRFKQFKERSGFTKDDNNKNRQIFIERSKQLRRPVFLKPEIINLLRPILRRFLGPQVADNSLIFHSGIGSIELLSTVLNRYLNMFGEISDDLFSVLYDDEMGLILEDAAIHESKLIKDQIEFLNRNNQVLRERLQLENDFNAMFAIVYDNNKYTHLMH